MRRWALLSAVSSLALVSSAAVVWYLRPNEAAERDVPRPPAARPAEQDTPLDPLLMALLRNPAKRGGGQPSPFFTALDSLARQHEDYIPSGVAEGYAVRVGAGHVAVVLRRGSPAMPGTDTQYLLLLDRQGRVRDLLSCWISNRLTGRSVDSGDFRTEVPGAPGPDGAEMVLRYVPEKGGSVSDCGYCEIAYRWKTYRFRWDEGSPGAIPAAEWAEKGLCRVAVREGKFAILFPDLRRADADR
jgi:hypothetical protein